MQRSLAMAGVRVGTIPLPSVDGHPLGYVVPDALWELLQVMRDR